ncbi:MAG: ADP-ribosylglycohydrolase family protein [Leptospiraceae bacterium]|nr:ADP-ribosylglycohydrolase family protein [Leptospiraceae bacterium]
MNTKLNLIKSGLWGVCVGDALGLPVQFKSRNYMKQNPVTDMIGNGTFNLPPGSWSDDGSLTLCIAESLSRGYDLNDIAANFMKWFQNGYLTPHGIAYDIGNSTSNSVRRLLNGTSPLNSGDANMEANGNGSLMRTLPLAFYFHFQNTPEDKKYQIIKEVSSITHAHPLSVVSCYIYIDFALQILQKQSLQDAFRIIVADKGKYYNLLTKEEQTYFQNIFEKDLKNFTEPEIKSSGFVIHSLEAAFWCLLNSSTYKETVLKAVNLGEDTDTIAAIAGGIAGIYYGYDNIPDNWVKVILKGNDIDKVCESLYKGI